VKYLLMFLAIALISESVSANCENVPDNFRKCFDNSNAPPALVYQLFVRNIFVGSLETEEYLIGRDYVEAGLTSKMSSDDVLHYFASRFLDIEKESEEAQKRTLCFEGKPRYKGAENFIVFNQLEEVSVNIYEKYLLIARSDLLASGLFDLDKALEEYPGSFVNMFMDHEKARGGSIQNIFETATSLCANSWGHQFSSSRSVGTK